MTNNKTSPRIVIVGAGSVGCYVGGRLLSAGADVVMVGRQRLATTLAETPLVVTDYRGFHHQVQLNDGQYVTSPEVAANADLVLVCVKSAATADAGRQLAPWLPAGVPVISLQNGVSNAERLQVALPDAQVLPGMIPFNVLQKSPGHFHHGTEGHLMCARHPGLAEVLPYFENAGLPLELRDDMRSVLWSKLLLNLNNPINALSGVPLLEELQQRDYRQCLAMAQEETLALLAAAGVQTVRLTALPMAWIPRVMRTPDWLFRRLAARMLAIDPIARSSMWEDLEAGRPTEVDWINGEVVRLAEQVGRLAPVNARLVALVHECELSRRRWSGSELRSALRQI